MDCLGMPYHDAPTDVIAQESAHERLDVWEHLQNAGGCTFRQGTNPLSALAADVWMTLALFTSKGECLDAMVRLYDDYYELRGCTLRDLGVEYRPPADAPRSVRDLFANRLGFLWQADLERAMTDAVAWAADWHDDV